MKNSLNLVFLIALIVLAGICAYLVVKPFLVALLLAFVLSQLFKRWYTKINGKLGNRPSLASFILCVILFFILAIPFLITGGLVTKEATNLYQDIHQTDWQIKIKAASSNTILKNILANNNLLDLQNIGTENSQQIATGLKSVGNFVFSVITKTYQGISHFIFMTFVVFFSLYYLFKDGDALIKKIMAISPLKSDEENKLLKNFISVSKATLKGSLIIAIIQGVLMGIILQIAGFPSPAIWGVITALVSLIPLLGAALIWVPTGIIMLFLGNLWQGALILAFGALVVSTIDNFLRPKLVGNETSLHPILVFLSTIGGIALFGLAGILLGPIIVVFFVSLLDIYQIEFKDELEKMNR